MYNQSEKKMSNMEFDRRIAIEKEIDSKGTIT